MLATFLNKKVHLMRLVNVGGNRKALQTVQTSICEVQRKRSKEEKITDGLASREYAGWFDIDDDIREGDVLRRDDIAQTYKVVEVQKKGQGLGLVAEHLLVTMVEYNM